MSFLDFLRPAVVRAEPEGVRQQFVSVTIKGEHFEPSLKPRKELDALINALSDRLAESNSDITEIHAEEGQAFLVLRGLNAEQVFASVRPLLEQTPIAATALIGIDLDDDTTPRRTLTISPNGADHE